MKKTTKNIIAALDLGSSKIVCFIAKINENGELNIIGIGHQVSQGIKSGVITDIKLAESAIRSTVGAAEEMAGVNVDRIIVSMSGAKQKTSLIKVQMDINGQEITTTDVYKMIDQVCDQVKENGYEIVHCIPLEYTLDEQQGVKDPRGMFCEKIEGLFNVITCSSTTLINLSKCLAKCHLDIDDFVSPSYASSCSTLNEDEKELGVLLIDIGGGNTSFAVFKGGNLLFTDSIPVAGNHITNDIAAGLSTNIISAERTKTLFGNLTSTVKEEQEMIDIPQIKENGDSETTHIERSMLNNIMRPRVEEILEIVKQKLESKNYNKINSVVITGGSSQLIGINDMAAKVFETKVKQGLPRTIPGLAESTKGPSFSTATGILIYTLTRRLMGGFGYYESGFKTKSIFFHVVKWLRENF